MKVTIFGDGFVRCHVYLMDLCLLIDKFGLFGLGKAAIYTSRRRLRWMRGGRWGVIGPAALLLSLSLFLPGACSSSHVWDHLTSGNQCKGCLQSSVKSSPSRSSPLSAVVLFLGCASGGVVPVGRARQAASTQWCTPLHSTLAAAPTFDPASLTKAVPKVSPLLTMSLPLYPSPVFGKTMDGKCFH